MFKSTFPDYQSLTNAIHLTWGKSESVDLDRLVGFQLLDHARLVQVCCAVADMWEEESGDLESADFQCFICLDPCDDADDPAPVQPSFPLQRVPCEDAEWPMVLFSLFRGF